MDFPRLCHPKLFFKEETLALIEIKMAPSAFQFYGPDRSGAGGLF
jgi:hypothetical protein